MKSAISLFLILLVLSRKDSKKVNRTSGTTTVRKPNIVLLYADDLGYADVGCYGAVGVETQILIKCPHMVSG
ncbi:hypothetical protein LS482_18660 [Sinomicrobium kalidii]|uniref:hypothetical protein n=1 Tax=Sinomicrobium kalidii TaxID=2900738 RepID=UPI001E3A79B6|nr:hypothetical protein [Sinomicrobium kalidii]UGU15691.1 hypothetical protein LS482_18660 [Sinomicrobium kalidii]